jgi:hypothetical protein
VYSSSHITDQTQITYELHTGAPKTKHEDRRPMIRWKNRQPGAQRVYCGAGQAYILKLSCLFRACSPKIQSTERVVSTFDLDMGVSFERSAFMGYLVHSAVTPALRATPLWRVASDPGAARSAPGDAPGRSYPGVPRPMVTTLRGMDRTRIAHRPLVNCTTRSGV